MKKSILLGTRGSRLALIQTDDIRNRLKEESPGLQIIVKVIKTEGDIDRSSPLSAFGGRGAFVRSIESALLQGEIDAAVHSLKDLPSKLPEGLVLGAVPVREDPRDVLVTRNGCDLISLPPGSIIGTGSERRTSQLMSLRPDITYKVIRGNVETRLNKLEDGKVDALVLAAAGLKRLGLLSRISRYLEPDMVLPAPCQGAIGVECREDDQKTRELLERIDTRDVRICVDAERYFIATLGMGCHTPVGALARHCGDSIVFIGYMMYGKNREILRKTIHTSEKNITDDIRKLALEFRAKIEPS